MGLDWNPGPKAKIGFERELESILKKMNSKWCWNKSGKISRFNDISQSAFETLNAPTVGVDENANLWAAEMHSNLTDKSVTIDEFMSRLKGFRVLDLIPACDGIPRYSNGQPGGYVERYAFRAEFLKDVLAIIGEANFESAYKSKLPGETVAYGKRLIKCATVFTEKQNISETLQHEIDDIESIGFKLDVVVSAGKWCVFWGERGHWLEAYY